MPKALIFDVDGTLAETEELHRRAFNDTFATEGHGWHWTRDDYARLLKTTGGKERIARHMAEIGADPATVDIPALHKAKTARYTALMAGGESGLRPGGQGVIDNARARAAAGHCHHHQWPECRGVGAGGLEHPRRRRLRGACLR